MNEKVKKYIEETQKEIDEAKRKEREAVLDELGLYTIGMVGEPREFKDFNTARQAGYLVREEKDGKYLYYRDSCGKTFAEITDEEFEQLCALRSERDALIAKGKPVIQAQSQQKKENDEYLIHAVWQPGGGSVAALFVRVLAVATWICGGILAFLCAYGAKTGFSFAIFAAVALGVAIGGGLIFCLSNVIEDINTIAENTTALRDMTIKKRS